MSQKPPFPTTLVTVKFANRKNVKSIIYNRKKHSNARYDGITSLPIRTKMYLNLREGKIVSMVTSHTFVNVNLFNKPLRMNHLKAVFPDYDFSWIQIISILYTIM